MIRQLGTLLLQIFLFVSLSCLIACKNDQILNNRNRFHADDGKIKSLSTIAMIGDLVRQIGGDYVNSITLVPGDLDPHSYQLVKGDDEKFDYADLIFYNGLGLEHGPSLQSYLERNQKALGLGNKILENEPSSIIRIQGQYDPHIWMDISLWVKTIPLIVAALSEKDPLHADFYQTKGDQLTDELLHIHHDIRKKLMSIPAEKRFLVTSHDAFNYFTKAYLATEEEKLDGAWRKRFAAPEGLAPESQLSPIHIRQIIDYLSKHHVHVIFPESNVSKDSLRKIVSAGKEIGLEITLAPCCLYADAMGKADSDGDTYQKMIQHNAAWIEKYLRVN